MNSEQKVMKEEIQSYEEETHEVAKSSKRKHGVLLSRSIVPARRRNNCFKQNITGEKRTNRERNAVRDSRNTNVTPNVGLIIMKKESQSSFNEDAEEERVFFESKDCVNSSNNVVHPTKLSYRSNGENLVTTRQEREDCAEQEKNDEEDANTAIIKMEEDEEGRGIEILTEYEITEKLINKAVIVTTLPTYTEGPNNTTEFMYIGEGNATGRIWWKQYKEKEEWMECGEDVLDIEKFNNAAKAVTLTRWRQYCSIQRKPGTSVLYDEDNKCHWYVKKAGESRFLHSQQQSSSIVSLPRNTLQKIFFYAIADPKSHYSLAMICHEFANICEERIMVVHTANITTNLARKARLDALNIKIIAEAKAAALGAREIVCKRSKWRGQNFENSKKRNGYGIHSCNDPKEGYSAGMWKEGRECGPCVFKSSNESSYNGVMNKGKRHGYGIKYYKQGSYSMRYEGSWISDKKHGYGLTLGGPEFCFMFGKWNEDEPLTQIMWNFNSDTIIN